MATWPTEDILEITCAELHALREADCKLRLVDCRENDEWQFNRISGAELVPLSGFAAAASARFSDPQEQVIIYCHHGMRSGQAAYFLRQRGHGPVWSLAGGIEAWAYEIDPSIGKY